ncbi:hypothetical protein ACH33_01915 [Aneurinibacillus sp. XH2]|nr:hypothetical protein ACH33_01915 [Aneurinibacillus sp. XH2]
MKKTMKHLLVWSMLMAVAGSMAAPTLAAENVPNAANNPYAAEEARIHEVLQTVMEKHLNSQLDVKRLTDGAIRGLLEETGDLYTTYFTNEEFEEFYNNLEGTFVGIGVYIQQENNKLLIESVFEGSTAAKAGLRAGDEIIAVDGKRVAGQSIEQVTEWMKGEVGSSIELTIKRAGKEQIVSLMREALQFSPVDSVMLDNKIGYMVLYTFSENSAEVFRKHLAKLRKDGMKGLILDLRDNGGGYLDAALEIADEFIDKGALVYVKDRSGKRTAIMAKSGAISLPVVVLVNGGTASASEVLTGALQDYNVAKIVGTKTFGKGTVQELVPLKQGGILKLTIEEYFSPKLRKINGHGITPDIIVENPNEQVIKAISYLHGSTALVLHSNGTASVAGIPAGESVAKKIDGKWFIALRPFAQLYGCQVYWDASQEIATMRCGETVRKYPSKNNAYVRNEKGVLWLSLEKLDSDFPSILVETRGDNLFVYVK